MGSPQEPSTCAVPTTKVLPQKDTTRPKVQKNAKFLHFFHFPSFSFILPPHFPSSTMYQFHPKILHFWYMLPPLSLCLFYSTHALTTKKRHNPFRLCHISVLLFALSVWLVPFRASKGTSHQSAFPYLSIFN